MSDGLVAVPNFPGYLITCRGNIWSERSKRWLKPHVDKDTGYLEIQLSLENHPPRLVGVHRLLLAAFVGPCPEGMECRHLDGNRLNNKLENLCWGTHYENIQDRTRHKQHIRRE